MPALTIPVIDMFFEDDDLRVGDGLFGVESGKELVCRRATGAALGGEQFDKNRGTRGLRVQRKREGHQDTGYGEKELRHRYKAAFRVAKISDGFY